MSQSGRSSRLTYRGILGAFIIAERKNKGAASDLFKLAQRSEGVADFNSQCKLAEAFYLSDAAGPTQVDKLPTKWGQTISDIRGAWKAGLDLNKFSSYHKLKAAKVATNAAAKGDVNPAHVQPAQPAGDSGVTVIGAADGDRPERGERPAHVPSGQDKRGASQNPELTMAQALEQGLVLDARTNVLMPEDMRPLVVALSKLDEMPRARLVKRFTKEAHDALSQRNNVQVRVGGARHEVA